jgi:hypothetical protein
MEAGQATGRRLTHRAHNADLARVARFRPHVVSFLCECGAPTCEERVHLTVSEYEAISSVRGRYVIASGHDAEWRAARTARAG